MSVPRLCCLLIRIRAVFNTLLMFPTTMSPRCSNVLRVPGPRSRIEEDVVPHTWLSDRWSHLQVVHTLHGIKALPAASSYLGRRMPQEIRQSKGFGRRPRQVKRSNSVLLWSQRHTLTSSQSSSTVFLDHCTKRHLVFIHCGLASSRYSSCIGLSQQVHRYLLERLCPVRPTSSI